MYMVELAGQQLPTDENDITCLRDDIQDVRACRETKEKTFPEPVQLTELCSLNNKVTSVDVSFRGSTGSILESLSFSLIRQTPCKEKFSGIRQ